MRDRTAPIQFGAQRKSPLSGWAWRDAQLGLGSVGMEELRKLDLSICGAFDPCLNLQATATLLDGYCRMAVRLVLMMSRQVMPQSWYRTTRASF